MKYEQVSSEMKTNRQNRAEAQANVDAAKTAADEASTAHDDASEAVSRLAGRIDQLLALKENVVTDASQEDVDAAKSDLADAEAALEQARSSLDAADSAFAAAQDKLVAEQVSRDEARERKARASSHVTDRRTELDDLRTANSEAQDKYDAAAQKLRDRNSELVAATSYEETAVSTNDAAVDAVAAAETELSDAKTSGDVSRISAAEDDLKQNEEALLAARSDLVSAESKLADALEAKDAAKIEELERKARLDRQKANFTSAEETLINAKTAEATAIESLDAAEKHVEGAETSVLDAEANVLKKEKLVESAVVDRDSVERAQLTLLPSVLESRMSEVQSDMDLAETHRSQKKTDKDEKTTALVEARSKRDLARDAVDALLAEEGSLKKRAEQTMQIRNSCHLRIARVDNAYPASTPNSFVIGFLATNKKNGKTKYMDVRVKYDDISSFGPDEMEKDETAAISASWDLLLPEFTSWSVKTSVDSPIVGRDWVV